MGRDMWDWLWKKGVAKRWCGADNPDGFEILCSSLSTQLLAGTDCLCFFGRCENSGSSSFLCSVTRERQNSP